VLTLQRHSLAPRGAKIYFLYKDIDNKNPGKFREIREIPGNTGKYQDIPGYTGKSGITREFPEDPVLTAIHII
jgi:hypothetical protein